MSKVQFVKTHEDHSFPEKVSTDPENEFRFKVDPIPTIDFATRELHRAQKDYFAKFPHMRGEDLTWRIELEDAQ